MIPLIDTNVIVRFLIGDQNPKSEGLYDFFSSLERGEKRVELKMIVLFQVIFVLKSFYKVPKLLIAQALIDLLSYRGIKIKKKKIVLKMLNLWKEHPIEIVDCYLLALLQSHPENVLYSYDHDFDKFGINRKEP